MSTKGAKLVLKKNKKLDKIYHPDTGLVFKSASERVVIGRIIEDEFASLDQESVDLCQQYGFRYDESLIEEEEQPNEEETNEDANNETNNEKSEDQDSSPNEEATNTERVTEESPKEPPKESPKESPKEPSVVSKDDLSATVTKPNTNPTSVPSDVSQARLAKTEVRGEFADVLRRLGELHEGLCRGLREELLASGQNAEELKGKLAESEEALTKTKKELEDVKRKLKGVLAAMQGDL